MQTENLKLSSEASRKASLGMSRHPQKILVKVCKLIKQNTVVEDILFLVRLFQNLWHIF